MFALRLEASKTRRVSTDRRECTKTYTTKENVAQRRIVKYIRVLFVAFVYCGEQTPKTDFNYA